MATAVEEFEEFVRKVRPRLLRAFSACRGSNGAPDAAAEALAYAWEHWPTVRGLDNPGPAGTDLRPPARKSALPSHVRGTAEAPGIDCPRLASGDCSQE